MMDIVFLDPIHPIDFWGSITLEQVIYTLVIMRIVGLCLLVFVVLKSREKD